MRGAAARGGLFYSRTRPAVTPPAVLERLVPQAIGMCRIAVRGFRGRLIYLEADGRGFRIALTEESTVWP